MSRPFTDEESTAEIFRTLADMVENLEPIEMIQMTLALATERLNETRKAA